MTTQNNSELSKWTGEDNYASKPVLSLKTIKLDGEKGGYFLREPQVDGVIAEIGEAFKATIIRVRRSVAGFTKEENFYTKEHDNWNERLDLFQNVETKNGRKSQLIASGTYKELKLVRPEIRLNYILYAILSPLQDVVKIKVRGKGVMNFVEYLKSFARGHLYEYETVFTQFSEENKKLRKKYFVMSFKRGERLDNLEVVAEKAEMLYNHFKSVEGYYAEKTKEYDERVLPEGAKIQPLELEGRELIGKSMRDKVAQDISDEEIPVIGIDDGEINVEEIPF